MDDELKEFSGYWNFSVKYLFGSRTGATESRLFRREHVFERLSRRLLEQEVGGFLAGGKEEGVLFLVCGSKQYIKETAEGLVAMGVEQANVVSF